MEVLPCLPEANYVVFSQVSNTTGSSCSVMANINPLSHLLNRLTMDFSHDLDKTQFESITQMREQRAQQDPLFIRFKPDKANRTLSIMHNGTAASKADLDAIVRSRTKEFLEEEGDLGSPSQLFPVIGPLDAEGSRFPLVLLEFLDERKIRDIVKEHPEIINYPIYLWAEKTTRPLDEPRREEESRDIVEVPYDWQLVREPKFFGTPKNHLAGRMQVEPTTSNWVLCKTIKDILGDKVVNVIIAPESFGDSSSFRFTRKRILEINPASAILEDLRKVVVETGENDGCVKQ